MVALQVNSVKAYSYLRCLICRWVRLGMLVELERAGRQHRAEEEDEKGYVYRSTERIAAIWFLQYSYEIAVVWCHILKNKWRGLV